MNLKFWVGLSCFLFITACTSLKPTPVYLTQETNPVDLIQPEVFLNKPPFLMVHHITTHYQNQVHEADGILERTPEQLRMIMTSPMGRLFTLNWTLDNQIIFKKGLLPPVQINPSYLLMDITLIYGDLADLQNHFKEPWKLTQKGLKRTLTYRHQPILDITYSQKDPFKSDISFISHSHGYSYELTRQP